MYLVCDGGGTKTDFLLFDKTGKILAQAAGTGANAGFLDAEIAAQTVCNGIEQCLAKAGAKPAEMERTVLFIPGFRPALEIVKERLGCMNIEQRGDDMAAFYAALGKPPGIAVLSGTGSFAIGCDRNGKIARAGGWGPLFSDEGSGYHMGVLSLARLAWLHDAGKGGTLLERLVLEELQLPDMPSVRGAACRPEFTRARVARLSYAVARAAAENDENAMTVLDEAAAALARLAATVAGRLEQQEGIAVALTGGAAGIGEPLTARFEREVKRQLPQAVCCPAKYTPIVGAAICLLSEENVDITNPQITENLTRENR